MATLKFPREGVERIVRHVRSSKEWQRRFDQPEGEPGKPAVLLVHDDGVYLMSSGIPRDDVTASGKTSSFVVHALGCDPAKDEDFYENSRALVGGDDFGEHIDVALVEQALAAGGKFLVLSMTKNSIRFVVPKRPAAPTAVVPTAAQPPCPPGCKPYVEVPVLFEGDRVEWDSTTAKKVIVGVLNSTRGARWKVIADDGNFWNVTPRSLRRSAVPLPQARKWCKGDRVVVTLGSEKVNGTVRKTLNGIVHVDGDNKYRYRMAPQSLQPSDVAAPKYEGPVFLPGSRVKFQHKGKWIYGRVRAILEGNRVSLDADDGFTRWRTPMSGLQDASGEARKEPPRLVEAKSLDEIVERSPRKVDPHDCEAHAVPYKSGGALGHGFECGICGKFLQAG